MVNELQVIVQQEPGMVSWNFEQLKESLAEMMSSYAEMVYTEDSISTAKSDVATLRKLRNEVEDRRKEVRRKCLEPYAVIEDQAKQLTALIDEPIEEISGQITTYENKRKREKKEQIMAFMQETFSDLPEQVASKLKLKVYSPNWENASTAKKVWTDAIKQAHEKVKTEIDVLSNLEDDFKDTVMKIYCNHLLLVEALQKANELREQREMLIAKEQERQRVEEEARRKAAEEEARKQAAQQIKPETMQGIAMPDPIFQENQWEQPYQEQELPIADEFMPAPEPQKPEIPPKSAVNEENPQGGLLKKTITILANPSQYERILGFINYTGAIYREVE